MTLPRQWPWKETRLLQSANMMTCFVSLEQQLKWFTWKRTLLPGFISLSASRNSFANFFMAGWLSFPPFRERSSTWSEFGCPANQHPKSTVKKNSPQTFAHLVNFSKNVSAMFDNHTILTIEWKTLSHVLAAWLASTYCLQRILGFFYLNHPQISGVVKSDRIVLSLDPGF